MSATANPRWLLLRTASAAMQPARRPAVWWSAPSAGALLTLLTGRGPRSRAPLTPKTVTDAIEAVLQESNREIHGKAKQEARQKGMGATAAVVVVCDGEARIGHVGDARVYHQRGDRLTQVTKDQTLAARMVELGRLSPKEALVHPARNDVYQAIGHHPNLKPVHYEMKLAAGDWLIVTSDGLHAHVDAEELQKLVAKAEPSAAMLAATRWWTSRTRRAAPTIAPSW